MQREDDEEAEVASLTTKHEVGEGAVVAAGKGVGGCSEAGKRGAARTCIHSENGEGRYTDAIIHTRIYTHVSVLQL